jgi:hypothetical protein
VNTAGSLSGYIVPALTTDRGALILIEDVSLGGTGVSRCRMTPYLGPYKMSRLGSDLGQHWCAAAQV